MPSVAALFPGCLRAAFGVPSCRRKTAGRSGGRCFAVLMTVGAWLLFSPPAFAVDADLSPQAQMRQYLREIAAAAQNNDHKTIVSLCEDMLKLEGMRMDDAIRFYYGRSLMELGRYADAEREIDLFLKSGNDDADLLDQALAMRDSLAPKKILEDCRNGFGHLIVFRESGNINLFRLRGGSPSRDELRGAANSPGMTESERGELMAYLGKRIFFEGAGNKNSEERNTEYDSARAVFKTAMELGNADGMFMYGLMLMAKELGGKDNKRGWELMRQANSKGGSMAKEYFDANPDKK